MSVEQDLAMLVRRLAHKLPTGHPTRERAMAYLKRVGLAGSPLRADAALPWQRGALAQWRIVGMNHYNFEGGLRLFVAMTSQDGRCIKAEGADEMAVFEMLEKMALEVER